MDPNRIGAIGAGIGAIIASTTVGAAGYKIAHKEGATANQERFGMATLTAATVLGGGGLLATAGPAIMNWGAHNRHPLASGIAMGTMLGAAATGAVGGASWAVAGAWDAIGN